MALTVLFLSLFVFKESPTNGTSSTNRLNRKRVSSKEVSTEGLLEDQVSKKKKLTTKLGTYDLSIDAQ